MTDRKWRRSKWLAAIALAFTLSLGSTAPLPEARAQGDAGYEAYQSGDYAQAYRDWKELADLGDADSQYNIGYLFDAGLGVTESKETAAQWYRRAAAQGHPLAQYNLAAMFVNGSGVPEDYVLAYMLFELSAAADRDALRELNDLIAYMEPLQIARANRLVREAKRGGLSRLLTRALDGAFSEAATTTESWTLGSGRDEVAWTQRALAQLGFDPGPVDGQMGPRTEAAIRAFAAQSGLNASGTVNDELMGALAAAFEERLNAEKLPYGQGVFWRVTSPEGKQSHILGTLHSSDPRILELPPKVNRAFSRAEVVALELDLYKEVTDEQLQTALLGAFLINDGRTLQQIAGRDLYRDVAAALIPFGYPSEILQQLQPWGAYWVLTQSGSEAEGETNQAFLDLWLGREAGRMGKQVVGLETLEEQLDVFAGLSEADQVALLDSVIAYAGAESFSLENLKRLYLAGDLDGVFRQTIEPARRLGPSFELTLIERLLDNRNMLMVERMMAYLENGQAFVAVGAAHLPGEVGVLNLLRQRGYEVAAVS